MKKRLVVGNWKMYVSTPKEGVTFARSLRRKARSFGGVEVWLAPSFTLLSGVAGALKGSVLRTGGQSISTHEPGPYTGEVSAQMLKAAGATFCIVGHSERRAAGETNDMIRAQFGRALDAGLLPILCVGEIERDPGGAHFTTIAQQLTAVFRDAHPKASRAIVAYEPVWAIGKSAEHAMQPEEVREMSIFIRKTLTEVLGRTAAAKIKVLYGGSVEPDNTPSLMEEGDISGLLVGHASTKLDTFTAIIQAVQGSAR